MTATAEASGNCGRSRAAASSASPLYLQAPDPISAAATRVVDCDLRCKSRKPTVAKAIRAAVARRSPRRPRQGLLADTKAIVTSDRWWAYAHLPVKRRQVCWAHLRRDFRAHAESLGAEKAFGEEGLKVCEELFWSWEIYLHTRDRAELKRRIGALRRQFKPILRAYAGKQARYRYTRGMARNLLKVWPALWTFADHNGIEPTNNHAERALRGSVIYRKLSFGTQSHDGERRIERLLSVHTTCRLQHRPLHDYLIDAPTAHSRGDPTPLLA